MVLFSQIPKFVDRIGCIFTTHSIYIIYLHDDFTNRFFFPKKNIQLAAKTINQFGCYWSKWPHGRHEYRSLKKDRDPEGRPDGFPSYFFLVVPNGLRILCPQKIFWIIRVGMERIHNYEDYEVEFYRPHRVSESFIYLNWSSGYFPKRNPHRLDEQVIWATLTFGRNFREMNHWLVSMAPNKNHVCWRFPCLRLRLTLPCCASSFVSNACIASL